MSFEAGGYGEIGIGWGKRPAVIVVDAEACMAEIRKLTAS